MGVLFSKPMNSASVQMPQSYVLEINPYLDANGNATGRYVNPPDAGYYVWESEDPRMTHKMPRNVSNQTVWMYGAKSGQNFFSHIGSSAQRLPNGNTLYEWSYPHSCRAQVKGSKVIETRGDCKN